MPTIAPERANDIIESWLAGIDLDGWENPAGPLFASGKYAEADITMTGGGGAVSNAVTGCGMCTGSYCNGLPIQCH